VLMLLTQLSSYNRRYQKVSTIIMKDHINGCCPEALIHGDHSDEHVNELISVVEKL